MILPISLFIKTINIEKLDKDNESLRVINKKMKKKRRKVNKKDKF